MKNYQSTNRDAWNKRVAAVLTFVLQSCFVLNCLAQSVVPGHAHNDYLNRRPLHEALENGLISVEADVHLMKGELYVAHIRPLWRNKKRTLENLYLKPLKAHIEKNNGTIYPNYGGQFYLMIDFKNGSAEMYNRLKELLEKYRSILSIVENEKAQPGAVKVFLSGSRPTQEVLNDEPKLATLDGRPSDIGKGFSADVMPVISDSYRSWFRWRGHGKMPEHEQQKLKELASSVHAEEKKLRLWASPDNANAWRTFQQLGVDLINTDKPKKFAEVMRK